MQRLRQNNVDAAAKQPDMGSEDPICAVEIFVPGKFAGIGRLLGRLSGPTFGLIGATATLAQVTFKRYEASSFKLSMKLQACVGKSDGSPHRRWRSHTGSGNSHGQESV
jgi:hypothetical protein